MWTHFLPVTFLFALALQGGRIRKRCVFRLPPKPFWPFAEQPGLALELAGSVPFVYQVLGDKGSKAGQQNTRAAILFQKLDFMFIALYTLFFIVTALQVVAAQKLDWPRALPAIACVLLAATMDVGENVRILGFLDSGSEKGVFPFELHGMVILEPPDGRRILVPAKLIRMIEVPPRAA